MSVVGALCVGVTLLAACAGQLIVNVRNQGGEVLKEDIHANVSQDTVTLSFLTADGTAVTQFVDFRNEVHIFKFVVLGEEDLGQREPQVICTVVRFIKNEFISSDAMSKLRQKNPSAVRHPEEAKPADEYRLDLTVSPDQAYLLSPHIRPLCNDASDAIYTRDADLLAIASSLNKDYTMLLGATKRTSVPHLQRCSQLSDMYRPCICRYDNCIGWYPCGLKYCKGKDSSGKTVNYRCGIKTCSKCRSFYFYSRQRQLCLWDLPRPEEHVAGEGDGKVAAEPQQGLPQQGLPQQGLPQQGLPQQGLPQQGLPQQGLPQQGLPQQGLPQQGLPQQGLPQQGLPQQGLQQQGLPQPGLAQQGLPQQGLPQQMRREEFKRGQFDGEGKEKGYEGGDQGKSERGGYEAVGGGAIGMEQVNDKLNQQQPPQQQDVLPRQPIPNQPIPEQAPQKL